MTFDVEHACGHMHTWENKWLDTPEHADKFEAFNRFLSLMLCVSCYQESKGILPS